jgi:hypothetical protein
MSHDHGEGLFNMALINEVSKIRDIWEARGVVAAVIDQNTTATQKNVNAARVLVSKARSVHELLIAMSNFSLSHQGLKTIR